MLSGIDVEVQRKRIKNLYLRVKEPDGRVVVSAPWHASNAEISEFVESRIPWIRKQQELVAARETEERHEWVTGEKLRLWGKSYTITVIDSLYFEIVLDGEHARFYVPVGSTQEEREAWLREWYREQLKAALAEVLPKMEELTGLKCAECKTRDMKTRWGSCNPSARRICLNVQLAKYPPECLEYVVLHELAHLVERSHGPRFKALLDEFMPDLCRVRHLLR